MMTYRIGVLSILVLAASCGKPSPSSETPELSAPTSSAVAAEAEVKASSGPVELTFLIYKTRIKLGESLWYQFRLRNIGSEQMIVVDRVFRSGWNLRKNINANFGTYIEIQDSNGQPLRPAHRSDMHAHPIVNESSGLLEAVTPEAKAAVAAWKKKGLSGLEIKRNLAQLNANRAFVEADEPFRVELPPGGTIETKSWFEYHDSERLAHRQQPRAIGEFAEIDVYDLESPGRYRIRAVYKRVPSAYAKNMRRNGEVYPDEVNFKTDWIGIEVIP